MGDHRSPLREQTRTQRRKTRVNRLDSWNPRPAVCRVVKRSASNDRQGRHSVAPFRVSRRGRVLSFPDVPSSETRRFAPPCGLARKRPPARPASVSWLRTRVSEELRRQPSSARWQDCSRELTAQTLENQWRERPIGSLPARVAIRSNRLPKEYGNEEENHDDNRDRSVATPGRL